MLILITVALLFGTALALLILRALRRQFRFAWLSAIGATFLAWITVLLWRSLLPLSCPPGSVGASRPAADRTDARRRPVLLGVCT